MPPSLSMSSANLLLLKMPEINLKPAWKDLSRFSNLNEDILRTIIQILEIPPHNELQI